jgi:hypothetical protein
MLFIDVRDVSFAREFGQGGSRFLKGRLKRRRMEGMGCCFELAPTQSAWELGGPTWLGVSCRMVLGTGRIDRFRLTVTGRWCKERGGGGLCCPGGAWVGSRCFSGLCCGVVDAGAAVSCSEPLCVLCGGRFGLARAHASERGRWGTSSVWRSARGPRVCCS